MEKLKVLAAEVTKCRNQGNLKIKGFPKRLKKKACIFARKFGQAKVAKAIGVDQSLITRWSENFPLNLIKEKRPSKKKDLPILFQEVLPSANDFLPRPTSHEAPFLRLTSPSGFSIELTGHHGAETVAIISRWREIRA